MSDSSRTAKGRKLRPKGLFSDALLDQLLTRVTGCDAEGLRVMIHLSMNPRDFGLGVFCGQMPETNRRKLTSA